MRSIGLPELLIVLGIAVLLFGGRKIPEVAKGLGEGIRNFKSALKDPEQSRREEAGIAASDLPALWASIQRFVITKHHGPAARPRGFSSPRPSAAEIL